MSEFSQRMVAVVNEKIDPGKIMNALAHMSVGLGGSLGSESMNLMSYIDAAGGVHPNISKMPLVILKANSNKIGKVREEALARSIGFTDFTETMTVGTWQDQEARTAQTNPEDLVYFGIMLFGDSDEVTALTRKFSLWK